MSGGANDEVHNDDSGKTTGREVKWGSKAERPKAVVSGREREAVSVFGGRIAKERWTLVADTAPFLPEN